MQKRKGGVHQSTELLIGRLAVIMDLLGSILGSMDKPPTPNEKEKRIAKGTKQRDLERLKVKILF